MINELDVTLTDFALTILSAILCFFTLKIKTKATKLRKYVFLLYLFLGLASLIGGLSHGFFYDETTLIYDIIWRTTLVLLGFVAFSCWVIGAEIIASDKWKKFIFYFALTDLLIYSIYVSFFDFDFINAIVNYSPSILFLLVSTGLFYARTRDKKVLLGILGLVLTIVAAIVQQVGFGFRYFDYNAMYHLIQGTALILAFVGFKEIMKRLDKLN